MRRIISLSSIASLIQLAFSAPPLARTADRGTVIPPAIRSGLEMDSKIDNDTAKRIVATFQNAGRSLILERTRGQADIDLYRKSAQAVVYVTDAEEKSSGSGALIDANGHVLTNWHVVRDHPRVFVVLKPRDSTELKKELIFVAIVEKTDEVADLALLRIVTPPNSLKYLELGDGDAIAVGQDVHAIGHPVRLTWTYTKGIVSQVRDDYEWYYGDRRLHKAKVIQTQTPINPGNSGGPLLDDAGRLVGINSFGSTQAQSINFAVSVDTVQEFLRSSELKRKAPQVQESANAKGETRCPDAYDTTGRGWKEIIGCYRSAISPPPRSMVGLRGTK